ncbi:hypothetical protein [Vibrio splendidus]
MEFMISNSQNCKHISTNIYLRNLVCQLNEMISLHQICHAERLINKRRQYLKIAEMEEAAKANGILTFFHMYSKTERYLDRQSLNYLLAEVEVRRAVVYKVSKFLDTAPEDKTQFHNIALKIFN